MRRDTATDAVTTAMRSAIVRSAILTVLLSACAPRSPSGPTPRPDRDMLTQADLVEHHFATAYEAVEALRPIWLQTRGANTLLTKQPEVAVYLNDTKLGGTDQLSSITTPAILTIRHFDGVAASGRWGLDHSQGVILVTTIPTIIR
jgi:hypothetical protein